VLQGGGEPCPFCEQVEIFVGVIVTLSVVRGIIDELMQSCAVAHIPKFELEHTKYLKHKITKKKEIFHAALLGWGWWLYNLR
jgi:hypothetical protein